MFKKDDYVVYKRDVCKIEKIFTYEPTKVEYYALIPIDDLSLTINAPVESEFSLIRPTISKKEVDKFIETIPKIEVLSNINDKIIDQEYKDLFNSGSMEDLVKIIKTAYLRNDFRLKNNKKISERDDNYFKKAERLLYNEFSIALNKNYEDTKDYVISKIGVD